MHTVVLCSYIVNVIWLRNFLYKPCLQDPERHFNLCPCFCMGIIVVPFHGGLGLRERGEEIGLTRIPLVSEQQAWEFT